MSASPDQAGEPGGWMARTGRSDGIEDLQAGLWRGNTWHRVIGTTDRWCGAVYHDKQEAMHSDAYYSLADAREWVEERLAEIAVECERKASAKAQEAAAIRAALAWGGRRE